MANVGVLEVKQLRGATIYEWLLTADGHGEPVQIPHRPDKTYAMFGTWGGATVVLEGGFDKDDDQTDATFQTLHESDNTTAISLTANGVGVVLENPIFIRPKMSSAGTTSVKVVLVVK